MTSLSEMQLRIKALCERIERAQAKYQGPPIRNKKVDVIAVSKFHAAETILTAAACGFTLFGENRVQELNEKLADTTLKDLHFDLIGSLQTNKVKDVVGKVRLIHSLDRESLLKALQKRASDQALIQDVLIQVNYSKESSKHGVTEDELYSFMENVLSQNHLRLRGLMTMAAPGLSEQEQLTFFKNFKHLFDESKERIRDKDKAEYFDVLSMGMSDDFEAALIAGSNCIRIGRAIFGERN